MTKEVKKVERTSAGLREALFDNLDGLRDGTVNPTMANATAKIAAAVVSTVEMEMDAYKLINKVSGDKVQGQTSQIPHLQLAGH